MREFSSRPVEEKQDQQAPAEVEFMLDGDSFRCVLRQDADAILEWSELAETATDEDINSPAGVAFTARFFKLMMPPDVYRLFRLHMKQHKTDPDTLMEIMQAINEEMQGQVEQSTARPTGPPSRSSDGRGVKDERIAKITSLPDADVAVVTPMPQQRRRPQDHQRKQSRRRRAG